MADARRRRHEREVLELELELQAEFGTLSVAELLDLRKPSVPHLYLSAMVFQKLWNLLLRILSLGVVRHANTLSDALSARQKLAELAEKELDRRRKSPATAQGRKAALVEYQAAVEERAAKLDDRQSVRSSPNPRRAEQAARSRGAIRDQVEEMFDEQQAAASHETVKARRAADSEAAAELRAAEDYVPSAIGFFVSKRDREKAVAANQMRARRVARAQALRDRTAAALREFLERIETLAAQHAQRLADREEADEKAEAVERDALRKELGTLPEQIHAVSVASAGAQRAVATGRAAVLVAEATRPRTASELAGEAEAAEAERLRFLVDRS